MAWYVTQGQAVAGPFTEAEAILAIHKGQITEEHRVQLQGTSEWFVVRSHQPFAEALERVRGATAAGIAQAKADELSPRDKALAWFVGIVVLYFVVYQAVNAPTSKTSAVAPVAETVSPPQLYNPNAPDARPDTPERQVARAAVQRAADAWKTYDALPVAKQNKDALAVAFAQAIAAEEPMDIVSGSALDKINRREYRRRAAPLILPEVRASGEDADVLVPSENRAKCLGWASQWSKESDSLATMGFHSIHCDSPSKSWALE